MEQSHGIVSVHTLITLNRDTAAYMTDIPYGGGRQRRGNPPTKCVCPQCGYTAEKTPGVPCRSMKCPKCDVPLMGE
jgi:hypothetical protein